jgi:hypothetical protein
MAEALPTQKIQRKEQRKAMQQELWQAVQKPKWQYWYQQQEDIMAGSLLEEN